MTKISTKTFLIVTQRNVTPGEPETSLACGFGQIYSYFHTLLRIGTNNRHAKSETFSQNLSSRIPNPLNAE